MFIHQISFSLWRRTKNFAFIWSLEINYVKADAILLDGMYIKNISKHFTIKLFNKSKQNFTDVIKYFRVATALVFYCHAKNSDILRVPVMFLCYLLILVKQLKTAIAYKKVFQK